MEKLTVEKLLKAAKYYAYLPSPEYDEIAEISFACILNELYRRGILD